MLRANTKPAVARVVSVDELWTWMTDYKPGAPVEMMLWKDPRDPNAGKSVEFAAVLITPADAADSELTEKLPIAFYYCGLGEKVNVILEERVPLWQSETQMPFVLVVPARPAGKWWFIGDDSHWGWISGDFEEEAVDLFGSWMVDIVLHHRIDSDRVGLLGFSAGAYAVTELLARRHLFGPDACGLKLSGVGLGGVHGHAQSDLFEIPVKRQDEVIERFRLYLDRLRDHYGVPWIEATHSKTDTMSRWKEAEMILGTLSERQVELGLSQVSIRLIDQDSHDSPPGGKKNRQHHDYFKAAFMRSEFLIALFGGEAPFSEKKELDTVMDNLPSGCIPFSEKRELDTVMDNMPVGFIAKRLETTAKKSCLMKLVPKKAAVKPMWSPPQIPPTSLKVEEHSVACTDCSWEQDAFRLFKKNGFVIVKGVLKLHQYNAVHRDCVRESQKLIGERRLGNRGKGRYSFGNASSTGSMLHVPSYAKHLLGEASSTLLPLLELIFEDKKRPGERGFICYSGGGDFVLGGTAEFQEIHSDIHITKQCNKHLPTPLLCVNFCVQELSEYNGPTRIVPGTQVGEHRSWTLEQEPDEWKTSRLCPVPAGAAIVRDARTLHGGTPNLTDKTRYLPSVEYVSADFRATNRKDKFPPRRCLPYELYEQLKPEVQELCQEIVLQEDEDPQVTFRDSKRRRR